jgi:hypothetical protein
MIRENGQFSHVDERTAIAMQRAQGRDSPLSEVRQRLEPVLGPSAARRARAFRNGDLYVDSTIGAALGAWFVDSLIVNGSAIGLGMLYFTLSSAYDKSVGALLIAVVMMIVLPFVYGWCYADGRAAGAMLAGTRSVRLADGGRIGLAKAGWAMLIRTLLLPFIFWVALGEGAEPGEVRVSIDEAATRRLRDSGVTSLA